MRCFPSIAFSKILNNEVSINKYKYEEAKSKPFQQIVSDWQKSLKQRGIQRNYTNDLVKVTQPYGYQPDWERHKAIRELATQSATRTHRSANGTRVPSTTSPLLEAQIPTREGG